MLFYIIDDRENDHTYIWAAVKAAFPDATFPVPEGSTFSNWRSAADYLRSVKDDIERDEAILLLDMSLGEGDAEAQVDEGIRRARTLRLQFPSAIIIACTQYDRSVAAKVRGDNPFHGVFAKEEWRALPDAERPSYVRTIIEEARPRSRSLIGVMSDKTSFDDSLGLRSFCAAFGDHALDELVVRFANVSDKIHVRALTGGLSGAFLFEVTTIGEHGRGSRIVKLARDREMIENEVKGFATHVSALGELATILLPPVGEIRTLPCGAFYLQQIAVDGEDLLHLVRRDRASGTSAVRKYVEVLASCVTEAISPHNRVRCDPLADAFAFTLLDLERVRVSAEFLAGFGPRLVDAGLWPDEITPEAAAELLSDLAVAWRAKALPFLRLKTPVSAQHGDAHLANVLQTTSGQLRLIDIARVGVWPTGYDMSRAAIQARLRLLDYAGYNDYMPERFRAWFSDTMDDSNGASLAGEFTGAFNKVIAGSVYEKQLSTAFTVGTLWDLLKIASYSDISSLKRVWAMLSAVLIAKTLTSCIETDE